MTEQLQREITTVNPALQGWCWPGKAIALAESVLNQPDCKIVVEVGVFGGRSLIPMAQACRSVGKGVVFGIDPWRAADAIECEHDKENVKWWTEKVDLHDVHKRCVEWIWSLGLDANCVLIRSKSEVAVHAFGEGTIDVLHIDGNHNEELSCRDAMLWLPKVRSGGVIWFDDVHWTCTKRAQEILAQFCDPEQELFAGELGSARMYRKK